MQFNPKISIITVVFNGKTLIERTIKSVLSQTYTNIEYIIIDGASSDGTLEIAEKYQHEIALILSGKDNGIYDAMNKGLKNATGDYVLFLNAGDELYSSDTLTKVFSMFADADVYYGNTAVVDSSGKELGDRRLTPPENLTWRSLKFGMCVSHQSFIAKRSLCDLYHLNYKISSDIDWVISILKKSSKIINTKNYISKFLEGGTSNKRRGKALKERFIIMVKHYGFIQTMVNHIYILIRYPFHKATKKSMT
ncbi:MAG: glycosyltransferase family 2 protein [Bacteroidia bacterium]